MLHGIYLIDKPEGPTSHDVIYKVRRALGMKKVGHAGTLDPFATGLLVVLLGNATRLARFFTDDNKEYEATCCWGIQTDTGDHTGTTVESSKTPMPGADQICKTLESFLGKQEQLPPKFSAKKVNGQKMYELARKGKEINRTPVTILIESLEMLTLEEKEFSFRVVCSKGTYIRTLAEDICRAMGGFGHLVKLRRISSGPYHIDNAVTIDDLFSLAKEEKAEEGLLSIESVCSRFPLVVIGQKAAEILRFGSGPGLSDIENIEFFRSGQPVRIVDTENNLLALVTAMMDSEYIQSGMKTEKAFKIEANFSAMPR